MEYGQSKQHFWWNHQLDELLNEVVLPFINGHVIMITSKDGKRILNMKNVNRVSVYETEQILMSQVGNSIYNQMEASEFEKNNCTEKIIEQAKIKLAFPQTNSILQKSFTVTENQVFVVMKFGDPELDSAYEGVIKPLFEEHGIKVIRVDEIQDSGKVSEQILENIAKSKYVFSDLSGARPNCYYETGFAHALGKEMILSIHAKDSVHFDLADYRFIQWRTEAELRRELKKRILSLLAR